jgi:putative antitoxin of VapBC-like toxin-antitoxin system
MHFKCMPFTTLTVKHEVAEKLRAAKGAGESYSDVLTRLLDNEPAKTVGEWLESLAPLAGRGVFTPEERQRLKQDQQYPRVSRAKRKGHAAL